MPVKFNIPNPVTAALFSTSPYANFPVIYTCHVNCQTNESYRALRGIAKKVIQIIATIIISHNKIGAHWAKSYETWLHWSKLPEYRITIFSSLIANHVIFRQITIVEEASHSHLWQPWGIWTALYIWLHLFPSGTQLSETKIFSRFFFLLLKTGWLNFKCSFIFKAKRSKLNHRWKELPCRCKSSWL